MIPSFVILKTLNFDVINLLQATPITCRLPHCR